MLHEHITSYLTSNSLYRSLHAQVFYNYDMVHKSLRMSVYLQPSKLCLIQLIYISYMAHMNKYVTMYIYIHTHLTTHLMIKDKQLWLYYSYIANCIDTFSLICGADRTNGFVDFLLLR